MIVCSGLGSGRRSINLQEFKKVSMTWDPGMSGVILRSLLSRETWLCWFPVIWSSFWASSFRLVTNFALGSSYISKRFSFVRHSSASWRSRFSSSWLLCENDYDFIIYSTIMFSHGSQVTVLFSLRPHFQQYTNLRLTLEENYSCF